MTTYYKHYFEEDNEEQYFELDEELHCLRSMSLKEGTYKTSNMAGDYSLSEGSFVEVLDQLTPIEEKEFQRNWDIAIEPYRQKWEAIEEVIKSGQIITATIICFYPQGVIMDIGTDFAGLLSIADCNKVFSEEKQYPGNSAKFRVMGFEEEQMWIILGKVD
ncbi:MAG: hypothetical protein AAFZ63_15680 [Bacteroidota bacterium]